MENKISYFDVSDKEKIKTKIITSSIIFGCLIILLSLFFYFFFFKPWNDCEKMSENYIHSDLAKELQPIYSQYGMDINFMNSMSLKECQSSVGREIPFARTRPEIGMAGISRIIKFPIIQIIFTGEFLLILVSIYLFGQRQEPFISKIFRSIIFAIIAFIDTVAVIYFMAFIRIWLNPFWDLYVAILIIINYLAYNIVKNVLWYFSFDKAVQ